MEQRGIGRVDLVPYPDFTSTCVELVSSFLARECELFIRVNGKLVNGKLVEVDLEVEESCLPLLVGFTQWCGQRWFWDRREPGV